MNAVLFFFKMVDEYAISHTRHFMRTGNLECHKGAVRSDDRVGHLSSYVIVEMGQPFEVLPRSIEAQLPDIRIARSMTAEPGTLTIALHANIFPIREDTLHFIVCTGRLAAIG